MRNRYVHRVKVVWPDGDVTYRHYQTKAAADRYAELAVKADPKRWEPTVRHRGERAAYTSYTRSLPVQFPQENLK